MRVRIRGAWCGVWGLYSKELGFTLNMKPQDGFGCSRTGVQKDDLQTSPEKKTRSLEDSEAASIERQHRPGYASMRELLDNRQPSR